MCRGEASNPGTWTGSEITFGQTCFPSFPLAYYLYLRSIPYQPLRSYLLNHPRGIVELVSAMQPYLYYISSATIYFHDSVLQRVYEARTLFKSEQRFGVSSDFVNKRVRWYSPL